MPPFNHPPDCPHAFVKPCSSESTPPPTSSSRPSMATVRCRGLPSSLRNELPLHEIFDAAAKSLIALTRDRQNTRGIAFGVELKGPTPPSKRQIGHGDPAAWQGQLRFQRLQGGFDHALAGHVTRGVPR